MEIKITIPEFNKINVVDEYDTDTICKQIVDHKRVMIRADIPGSGKSYICEYFIKLGYNILFVVPANTLVQKYGEACTLNDFFGIGVNNEKNYFKN